MTTNTLNIASFNMATLVSMVNDLGGTATMKTFSQRSKAVERINKLVEAQKVSLTDLFDDTGAKKVIKVKAVKAAKVAKEKKISIRSVAEALLLQTTGVDKDDRVVGLSYDDILTTVKTQFPDAKTTVGCLRWYAASMRDAGTVVPARPRAEKAPAVVAPTAEAEVAVVEVAAVAA